MSKKNLFLKNIKKHYSELKVGLKLSKWLENKNLEANEAYYSFWMNQWALALAILKKKKRINNFVFRINGYDIYDERHPGNYLPFRDFIYKYATRIIPLSTTSEAYVKSKTRFKDKVRHSYFGTQDFGFSEAKMTDDFIVFTCSSAIPLKRLDKIAEVLICLNTPVKWVHHGDGETIKQVEEIIEKSGKQINFVLSEKKSNYDEVIQLQKQLSPSVFINLSTTEGLPVTIMEALSLGTPILVNDVGSCAEIVRPFNGILVGSEELPEEIAKKLINFIPSNNFYDRVEIREFWRENFYAKVNYKKFAIELKEIFNDIKK